MKKCKCGCGLAVYGKSGFRKGHSPKKIKKSSAIEKSESSDEVTLSQMAEHIKEPLKEIKAPEITDVKPGPPAEAPKENPKAAPEQIPTFKYICFLVMTNLLTAAAVGLYLWRRYAP